MALGRERDKAKESGRPYANLWRSLEFPQNSRRSWPVRAFSLLGRTLFLRTGPALLLTPFPASLPLPPRPPSSLPPPSPRPLRDADGGCPHLGFCVSLCSSACLRGMPFPHEEIARLLHPAKPSAGLLNSIYFATLQISLKNPIYPPCTNRYFLLSSWVGFTSDKLPKYHILWQTLLSHTFFKSRKHFLPLVHYHLYTLGSCPGKRLGVPYGLVVALLLKPS